MTCRAETEHDRNTVDDLCLSVIEARRHSYSRVVRAQCRVFFYVICNPDYKKKHFPLLPL